MFDEQWSGDQGADQDFQPTNNDSKSTLSVRESAEIFINIIHLIISESSPFADAIFVQKVVEKFSKSNSQFRYFTSEHGFGANIVVRNGLVEVNMDLNIQEGLKSRNLSKRAAIRLGKDIPTDSEIFWFAVSHEFGHLIQGLADKLSLQDQDLRGMTQSQIEEVRQRISEYNRTLEGNEEIVSAQEFFRSIFGEDIQRDGENIDPENYSDEDYLAYVNSDAEANADFISLWLYGMRNPDFAMSPQSQGYSLDEWRRWSEDHRILEAHIS